ncbi:hypothetical protein FRC14_007179 [Serendipita sp. 396]|nr:hypothetical protein FRC14_007179 [Serendipita sp. 396]
MDLKGPKGGNIITGQIAGAPSNGAEPDIWFLRVSEKYGPVTVIRAPWNTCMLWTCDHKAMSHILVNSDLYHRPDYARWWFGTFVGRGVIIAHGESHSRQRRIMNPAFGVSPIKQMTEVFVDKTLDLCDVFRSLIDKEQHHSGGAENGGVKNNDSVVLDMSLWLGRAALDMMTIICFQINLDVLGTGSHSQGKGPGNRGEEQKERGRESDELYPALEELFGTNDLNFSLLFWKSWIPLVRLWTLDESSHKIERCHGMIRTLAKKLIKEREKEILAGSVDEETRDLLTLLTKATMEKVNKDRMMSLDEACEQISTYFVAGQETSAAAVTWGLHSLSNDQAVQTRLREELDTVGTDHPTKEQLDGLPYLDLVVREMLRLHSPGAWIEREATKDDVIPFEKPFTDRHGNVRQHLPCVYACSLLGGGGGCGWLIVFCCLGSVKAIGYGFRFGRSIARKKYGVPTLESSTPNGGGTHRKRYRRCQV